jgi:predicted MFS family arabinose efflux permease
MTRAGYRWYVLGVLGLVYAIHAMDRTVVNLVLEPVKAEFHLSDGALGFLTGLAYAVPFAITGLPLGALADRRSRKWILAALVAVWSAATALGGLARSFGTLLPARMAVGAAESGSPPTALSLVADYFPARLRATAVSVFYVGAPAGGIFAALIAGPVTAAYGWRATLVVAAIPGLVLAVVIALTVRDPPVERLTVAQPPLREVFGLFVREKGVAVVIAALVFAAMSTVGITTWMPALLSRAHGLSVTQVSSLMTWSGVVGIAGTLLGGVLAYFFAQGRTFRLLVLSAAANVAQVPVLLAGLYAAGTTGFTVSFFAWTVLQTVYYGAGFGLVATLAPPRMRARVLAITFVLANVLGAGLGPQIIGALSDAFAAAGDTGALTDATGVLVLAAGIAGLLFLSATRFLRSHRETELMGQPDR